MQKKLIAALVLLVPLAFSGCATLNEDECNIVDWYDLGNRDGQAGRNSSYIANHVKACSKFGVVPDQSAWNSGWSIAIRQYCTPANGLAKGKAGNANNNACPADLSSRFNAAYSVGRDVYNARAAIERLTSDIEDDISDMRDASPEERGNLRLDIELKRLKLFQMQSELNRAERRADEYAYSNRL